MNKAYFLIIIFLSIFSQSCKKKNLNHIVRKKNNESYFTEPPFNFCNDGEPVGGGNGYSKVTTSKGATFILSPNITGPSFISTVQNATFGDRIFLPSTAVVDIGSTTLIIPEGVTICSDRGFNGSAGAIIKTNYISGNGASITPRSNVRISGLRIRGGSQDYGSDGDGNKRIGIVLAGYDNFELDNCEVTGWPGGGIYIGLLGSGLQSNNNNRIHHNFIYWNKGAGLGYGVSIDNGYAVIYKNVFMGNRHDITCSGYRNSNNTGYEAYCNTIKTGGIGNNFDSHGEQGDDLPNASTFFYIHHNYFEDIGEDRVNPDNKINILIRGRPDNQCRIEHNIFKFSGPTDAIRQQSYGAAGRTINTKGNLLVFNNVYGLGLNGGPGSYLGWYVTNSWPKKKVSNFLNLTSTNDLLHSSIDQDNIIDYAFSDINGDGFTDIIKCESGKLFSIPYKITNGLTQFWTELNTCPVKLNKLRFGHYNNDSKTDAVYQYNGVIYISSGCTSPWVIFNSSSYSLNNFISADFTGDQIEDFFMANGGQWYLINNATPNTNWVNLGGSSAPMHALKVGWFLPSNSNNSIYKADIFYSDGSYFKTSFDAIQNWVNLTNSSYTYESISIFDFNRDGISDVITNSSNPKQVCLSGQSSWSNCTVNNFPINNFPWIQ